MTPRTILMITSSITRKPAITALARSPRVPSTVPNNKANVMIPSVLVPSLDKCEKERKVK